ncbi:YkgJ family cysteine cluster protein [Myxococcus qinghaiensis]|uniref:YkgJ family cysteine cluster protein n=1 Tax=Myxococcus qinghaiensis TaxID=2906758 RepID=UPI0020A6EEB2|nr:YkgJ family cysteine cluster protein [Myxococcus qinghaiensis]MCP3169884.1 YkgJ family cysteine cluster protein [Myxococcus qinghaiensis]
MECTLCGACCVAPDIAALDKPLGLRCPHLTQDNLCSMYENRPNICRDYQADEVCKLIEAPTLEERVDKYLALFGLTDEAKAVKQQGCASMKRARLQTSPAQAAPSPTEAPGGERPR